MKACGYTNGDWECRKGGYLYDAGSGEGWDASDCTYICPCCRTGDYLESAKDDAESTSYWMDCGTTGTGVDIWISAEKHAIKANKVQALIALKSLGIVKALEQDDSEEGYAIVFCNTQPELMK